tara:strand:+ start:1275 stop:2009 length:735 start_codon:yes stop_codon:yes gene_type:complete
MSNPCISYEAVTKSYGKKVIIEDLSLDIPADITTAIVGESGSGKSTLLQMANGLVKPEKGQVSVFNKSINKTSITLQRLKIGYSVQGAGLFPHLSVFNNVILMARLLGWADDAIQSRFQYLLDLFELDTELSPRYPYSLSGGQQQRVSLCRAMMLNPPLLLLDEPFSALDPVTREIIHSEFLRLQAIESRTTVLVTHDMGEAMKLAQQVIVLYEGRIEQQGSVEDIQNNPASDYVETLFRVGGN